MEFLNAFSSSSSSSSSYLLYMSSKFQLRLVAMQSSPIIARAPAYLYRFVGSTHSSCRESQDIAEILNRPWLLSSPRTKVDQKLNISENLYVIRDDLLHPTMGGNKLRKLDALLPLLRAISATDVITCGGCQSAHAAALAVACAENGLRAHLLLRGERLAIPTGYNLISGMYGEVSYVPRSEYADRKAMLKKHAESIAENGSIVWMEGLQSAAFNADCFQKDASTSPSRRVAIVKEGASDVIALLGLIRLVHYLAQPCCFGMNDELQLVVDSGTGTTAVGLAIGIILLRLPWEVISVMLVGGRESYISFGAQLLADFNMMYGESRIFQEDLDKCIKWVERKKPRKFGNVLEGEIQDCRAIAKETGILFDPIYTLAAWETGCDLCMTREKKVAILHTGGTMGIFGLAQRYSTQF